MSEEIEVAIVMGSKSDEHVAKKAADALSELGIKYEVKILSAHRNPDELREYIRKCKAKVFIAIAGLSAHLPGFIASHTDKPVIGVPVNVQLGGLDALLSMVQMPPGVPVATVGIDNGRNAALLAARILALFDERIKRKLEEAKSERRG